MPADRYQPGRLVLSAYTVVAVPPDESTSFKSYRFNGSRPIPPDGSTLSGAMANGNTNEIPIGKENCVCVTFRSTADPAGAGCDCSSSIVRSTQTSARSAMPSRLRNCIANVPCWFAAGDTTPAATCIIGRERKGSSVSVLCATAGIERSSEKQPAEHIRDVVIADASCVRAPAAPGLRARQFSQLTP